MSQTPIIDYYPGCKPPHCAGLTNHNVDDFAEGEVENLKHSPFRKGP